MCGRISIAKKESDLEKRFNARFTGFSLPALPLFNIGPSMHVPIITDLEPEKIQWVKWGLVPSWSKDNKITPPQINARKETVLIKPYFKEAIQKRRCLVLLDGYFEWKAVNKGLKIPYFIHLKNKVLFAVAGLWEENNLETEPANTVCLITQNPNEKLSAVHDRMPGILSAGNESKWLDKKLSGEKALELIQPYQDSEIIYFTVNKNVNRSFENDPSFLIPTPFESIPVQGNLF